MQEELQRAESLATQGAHSEAEAILRACLAQDPHHKRTLDLLGFVLYFQHRYVEAEECCRTALELVADDPYATKGLGLCLARQGRIEEGLACIEKAARLRPSWFDVYWDWIVVLHEAGRNQAALDVLARAEELLPNRAGDLAKLKQALLR